MCTAPSESPPVYTVQVHESERPANQALFVRGNLKRNAVPKFVCLEMRRIFDTTVLLFRTLFMLRTGIFSSSMFHVIDISSFVCVAEDRFIQMRGELLHLKFTRVTNEQNRT
ncbi:hypothetical protein KC19_8G169800 [Ceratodon purpureus]|uniref:Uncharacterized protein n=1 Tax=Ceratodon purpureus TaxID=3225 RepID=A0A8T0GZT6_CERPU|nr:hypothetical protein KC19_8G169800 [Ceratodon purpureus]